MTDEREKPYNASHAERGAYFVGYDVASQSDSSQPLPVSVHTIYWSLPPRLQQAFLDGVVSYLEQHTKSSPRG